MSSTAPTCQTITVFAFRDGRSRAFATSFQNALDDEKYRKGSRPSVLDCQLYSGHTGVSTDGGATIYGFNPDGTNVPVWQLMDDLKNGAAFPGVVSADTGVFSTAAQRGLGVLTFEIILPDPWFQGFRGKLDAERKKSQYTYGFPNGDGDCNCTTWLERLGLPLLTGRMNEFVNLSGISSNPSRRFGWCV
jgi:hypothetical protein